jgi:hypothetical protein
MHELRMTIDLDEITLNTTLRIIKGRSNVEILYAMVTCSPALLADGDRPERNC